MIRINLLPPEDRAKKREFHLPEMSTIYLVVGVAAFFIAVFTIGFMQHHKVSVLEKKISIATEESKALAPQLAKIKQITKEREEVDRRLNLITSLDKFRYFRVKLMSDISYKLPSNCWLTDITELSPNNFNIDGIAFNNFTVADMITNLESSPVFTHVDLRKAEKGEIKDREVMKFSLNANVMPQ
ncbi:MAG: PilN domain-containing protein [Candidatus Krumholzibacteriota bacterium]|nr:PilN domain-containing protein [Candidatus Krumholzibacteriota bacterium]